MILDALALVLVTPAAAPPGEDDNPIANPDLPLGCGLDTLVMLEPLGTDPERIMQMA
jgi:hypothetical protein